MKKKIVLLMVSVLAVVLVSCYSTESGQADEIKAYCETMINSILIGDLDKGIAAMSDGILESDFAPVFEELKEYLYGVNEFSLQQEGWHSGNKNGKNYYEATFKMTTNTSVFFVTGTMMEGYNKLYNFNIVLAEDSAVAYTGTLTSLSGSNILQWGILVLSVLTLAAVICSIVDCCMRNIKYKVLWIILMIACMLVITSSNHKLNFNLAILNFTYSHMKVFSNGDYSLQLVVPLGTLTYFAFRDKLEDKPNSKGSKH